MIYRSDTNNLDPSGRTVSHHVLGIKPLEYDGKQRGHPAEGWHVCIEDIFEELNIPNSGLKAKLAAITLTEDAARW